MTYYKNFRKIKNRLHNLIPNPKIDKRKEKKTEKIRIRCTSDTFKKFKSLSIKFPTLESCIKYLMDDKISLNYNTTLNYYLRDNLA